MMECLAENGQDHNMIIVQVIRLHQHMLRRPTRGRRRAERAARAGPSLTALAARGPTRKGCVWLRIYPSINLFA